MVHQGGSLRVVGLVVSAYGLAQLLLRLPLGLASDARGRRKPFLVLGFLAAVAASFGFVLAPHPWFMVAARFISGIAACAWVAFTVLFASSFPPNETIRAMGYLSFCNSLAIMAATYAGGRIADAYGWQAPFWTAAGVGGLGLLSLWWVQEQPQAQPEPQPPLLRLRELVRYPELLLASAIAALGHWTIYATTFGFVPLYAAGIGATKTQLGLLATLSTLAGSVAALLSGAGMARWLGARLAVAGSHLLIAVATLAIPYLTTVGLLYFSQTLAGFGRGLAQPVLLSLAVTRLPEGLRATAMGLFQAIYAVGMFAGPATAGLIGSLAGYAGLFLACGAVAALTASLALYLPRSWQ
ncbi:MAG: MFS transporter [Candidatus Tectimicrobiota bacterium]|nr:MAG: MFS transporter [Candidatus Tectomicrobia bacterium]